MICLFSRPQLEPDGLRGKTSYNLGFPNPVNSKKSVKRSKGKWREKWRDDTSSAFCMDFNKKIFFKGVFFLLFFLSFLFFFFCTVVYNITSPTHRNILCGTGWIWRKSLMEYRVRSHFLSETMLRLCGRGRAPAAVRVGNRRTQELCVLPISIDKRSLTQ